MSTLKAIVPFLAVMMAGLIAGLMGGTGMDQYTQRLLHGSEWVMEHQAMDALFSRVMPPFWNASVLVLIAAAIFTRGSARSLFAVAAMLLAVSLVVTVSVEVPMNCAIALWNASSPPANWGEVRDRWLSFHLARTILGVVAFGCATSALMTRRPMQDESGSLASGGHSA
jgi:uncharacterized membrane protein